MPGCGLDDPGSRPRTDSNDVRDFNASSSTNWVIDAVVGIGNSRLRLLVTVEGAVSAYINSFLILIHSARGFQLVLVGERFRMVMPFVLPRVDCLSHYPCLSSHLGRVDLLVEVFSIACTSYLMRERVERNGIEIKSDRWVILDRPVDQTPFDDGKLLIA